MNGRRIFICRASLVALLAATPTAWAAKLSKAEVQYRDRPNSGKDCDDCIQFVPGSTPKAAGSCKVVAGAISPHGYCLAFTPKPSG
jgi:hypothetical protein